MDTNTNVSIISTLYKLGLPVKNSNATFSTPCPFHDDKNPSLIIYPKVNRYECKACGKKGDAIDFVEKIKNLDFKGALDFLAISGNSQPSAPKQQPIDPKDYLASRGITEETAKKFGLEVCKDPTGRDSIMIPLPTGEKFRRVNPRDKNDRFLQASGTHACLYKTEDASDEIILCEGELDAIRLWQEIQLPIWSGTVGAETFKQEWKQDFDSAKTVYLCFDNDEAGRKGAENAAQIIGSEKCRMIQLPTGVKDVTEFFQLGYTMEDFSKLMDETKKKPSQSIEIPNALAFTQQDFGKIEWLVDKLIPIAGSALLVAKRESYKTWLGLHITNCVSKGLPLWGKIPTTKTKVLYISSDDPPQKFQGRVSALGLNEDVFIYHRGLPNFLVETQNDAKKAIVDVVTRQNIGLVIVDILRNTHSRDSNTDKDAQMVLGEYNKLREINPNLTFLFIIHPSKEQELEKRFGGRKSEEAVGSYYWEAAVDTVLSLIKTTDSEGNDQVVVTVTKNKQSDEKIKPFIGIRKVSGRPVEFIYNEDVPDKAKKEQAKEFILGILSKESFTRQELIARTTKEGVCRERMVEEALKELYSSGQVTHTTTKPHIYSLPKDSANRNGIYGLRNAESSQQLPISETPEEAAT